MKLLDKFFKARQRVFDYFGYVENWRVFPLDDATEYYWYLTGEGSGDEVIFAKTKENLENDEGGLAGRHTPTTSTLSDTCPNGSTGADTSP